MTRVGSQRQSKKKGKGKVHPRTGHEGQEEEYRYSCTLSLTSALDGVGGQRHAPTALPPGEDIYRQLENLCCSKLIREARVTSSKE